MKFWSFYLSTPDRFAIAIIPDGTHGIDDFRRVGLRRLDAEQPAADLLKALGHTVNLLEVDSEDPTYLKFGLPGITWVGRYSREEIALYCEGFGESWPCPVHTFEVRREVFGRQRDQLRARVEQSISRREKREERMRNWGVLGRIFG